MKALTPIAIIREEEGELFRGLDPFRYDMDVQAMSHRNDRHNYCRIACIARDIADEGLVDFERVDGIALQVTQA